MSAERQTGNLSRNVGICFFLIWFLFREQPVSLSITDVFFLFKLFGFEATSAKSVPVFWIRYLRNLFRELTPYKNHPVYAEPSLSIARI